MEIGIDVHTNLHFPPRSPAGASISFQISVNVYIVMTWFEVQSIKNGVDVFACK